ncbi:MAG: DUF4870 domain-containing protein [Chthoniobacteraceae bacterium]|nr:DUF4870 domain-containing protein [Chthoniobacteraceae bacterium]
METPNEPSTGTPETPLLPAPPTPEERTWALAAHLSAFAGYSFPFGNIWGPLIIWLVKRDSSEFVADQAKEALNAQISITIYAAICILLMVIVIGLPLLLLVVVANVILIITAAASANQGNFYRYPYIFRLVK